MHRALFAASTAALVALGSASAHAANREPADAAAHSREGTVVAIDAGDLVIDLGVAKGVHDADVVELWRPVKVRHPVTGQVLVDRFRIGRVRLAQVRATLSLAHVEGEPLRKPEAGDIVIVPEAAPTAEPVATIAAPPSTAPRIIVEEDRDAQALSDLFVTLTGSDPKLRIRAYESFVAANPKSRFAAVLREEVKALREGAKVPPPEPFRVVEQRFARARPGVAQRYAVELDERFAGAVVHVRKTGDAGYRSIPMASLGPRYWGATLPGDALAQPGMEYFVEGVPENGPPIAIVGTADTPRDVAVDPLPTTGKQPGTIARIEIATDYASFNTKKANDWMWQTEGAFGWRLHDVGLRAVRSGFGVIRGQGGSLNDLDTLGKNPTDIGLTYGWIELEAAITQNFSLIGRPIVGLRDGGVSGGAQGFFRIGSDLRTNLLVGGEVLGEIGVRGIVQLDWRTIHRVPIVLRTEVTNQPAGSGGDVGARAIAQVGYEILPELTVAGRVSYQGRTINHAGPGTGLAVSYQW